jgi:hypothetical protein
MLETFRKFVGFTVLEYFLTHPTEKAYLKELAKKLQVSPRSIKIYCDLFEKEGIINREIRGNVHLFSLNNDVFTVREMKRTYMCLFLRSVGIEDVAETPTSLAIYGTYASGSYDERSDIDLLILGEEKDVKRDRITNIMKKIDREIQLTVIPPMKWEKMKQNRDSFVESILKKHVLIKGAEL